MIPMDTMEAAVVVITMATVVTTLIVTTLVVVVVMVVVAVLAMVGVVLRVVARENRYDNWIMGYGLLLSTSGVMFLFCGNLIGGRALC